MRTNFAYIDDAARRNAASSNRQSRRTDHLYRVPQPITQSDPNGTGHMVAVRDKIARFPPTVDYDRMADVLYVSLGKPVPDEGEERPRGIVLRFAIKDNLPSGVTVIGLRRNRWGQELLALSELIGSHLGIDRITVLYALEHELKE